jgi:hypothetical protein
MLVAKGQQPEICKSRQGRDIGKNLNGCIVPIIFSFEDGNSVFTDGRSARSIENPAVYHQHEVAVFSVLDPVKFEIESFPLTRLTQTQQKYLEGGISSEGKGVVEEENF